MFLPINYIMTLVTFLQVLGILLSLFTAEDPLVINYLFRVRDLGIFARIRG